MDIMTLNVDQFMSTERQLHDIERAPEHAGIICWQEIADAAAQRAVRGLDGHDSYFPTLGTHTGAQPISWSVDQWVLVDAGFELLHPETPGICENRYLTWVILRRRGTRKRIAVVNTHYVARAWSPSVDPAQAQRRAMWLEGNRRHHLLIRGFVARGIAVFGAGDFNRQTTLHGVPLGTRYAGRRVQYLTQTGIDYLFFIPGKRLDFDLEEVTVVHGFRSDHQGRLARGSLRRTRIR